MRVTVTVLICLFVLTAITGFAQSTPTLPIQDLVTGCTAPTLPGFVPYIVQPGDRLRDLMTGVTNLTIIQVAALNCLDDTVTLPPGAVIWLPENPMGIEVIQPASDSNPDLEYAHISRFQGNSGYIYNQEGITFNWAAEGSEAYLYPCTPIPHFDCIRPFNAMQVPLAYSVTIRDFQYAGRGMRYRLEVVDGDAIATQDFSFQVVCSQMWLVPMIPEPCATHPPHPSYAAWQPFEGGIMIWFADTREIYVLFNEGHHAEVFIDPYISQPSPTLTPPENRFVPLRGFGQIWLQVGGEESELGWALAEEIGFDSARQPAGRQSYTTYIQGPGATVYAVTLIPGTNRGFWTQVAA